VTNDPVISSSVTLAGLTISSNGLLTISTGGNLTLNGDFSNSGTFTADAGTVAFTGTSTVSGSGTFTFNNVTINTSSITVKFDADVSVVGTFTKGSGTFSQTTCNNSTGPKVIFTGSSSALSATSQPSFCDLKVASGATLTYSNAVQVNIKRNLIVDGTLSWTGTGTLEFSSTGNTGSYTGGGSSTINGTLSTSAATKTVNPLNHNVTLMGDLNNPGTITATGGKITFSKAGTSACCSTGTTTFYDLEISADTTLDVSTNTLFNATNSVRNYGKLKQTQTVGTDNVAFLNLSSGKYYGVELDPEGSTSLGSTTVTIYGKQNCPTPPSLGVTAVKRCWDIAPTTATATTVKFWYDNANELNGNTASSVKMYHAQDGLWYTENGTYTRSSSGGFESVQVTGVSSFSRFAATSNTPTAPTLIALSSFTATPTVSGVVLAWQTASELDTAGFNLWRSETPDGGYRKINPALIPAAGGPTWGASYTFTDVAVVAGATCYYKLEEVDVYGQSAFHGPTVVTVGMTQARSYLPLVGR
jgi:hypothetical protein